MSNKPDGIDADIWEVASSLLVSIIGHGEHSFGLEQRYLLIVAQALQAERNKAKALERILDEIHKADFAAKENDLLYRTLVVRALKNHAPKMLGGQP